MPTPLSSCSLVSPRSLRNRPAGGAAADWPSLRPTHSDSNYPPTIPTSPRRNPPHVRHSARHRKVPPSRRTRLHALASASAAAPTGNLPLRPSPCYGKPSGGCASQSTSTRARGGSPAITQISPRRWDCSLDIRFWPPRKSRQGRQRKPPCRFRRTVRAKHGTSPTWPRRSSRGSFPRLRRSAVL